MNALLHPTPFTAPRQRFWKSTRPDGTDWFSGTIDYGRALQENRPVQLPGHYAPQVATNTVVHAATEVTESLWGPGLPARLFIVEGSPVTIQGCTAGFFHLDVIQEIDPATGLGPHCAAVLELFDQAAHLSPRQASRIAEVFQDYRDDPAQQIGDARRAANLAKSRLGRLRAVKAAQRTATRTLQAALPIVDPLVITALQLTALATVVQDLIIPAHFHVLAVAWEGVLGPNPYMAQPAPAPALAAA